MFEEEDSHMYGDSDKEIEEIIKAMRKLRKKICATRESARAFLVKAGIITKKGNLREPYR